MTMLDPTTAIAALLKSGDTHEPVDKVLRGLIHAELDRLPCPGAGRTLLRWRALAAVGAHDLALAKLYEGHTDALAILHELHADAAFQERSRVWGVWAAEPPDGRVEVVLDGTTAKLRGTKRWCSGAATSTHALLTAWAAGSHEPVLVALALDQRGVHVDTSAWKAVGMGRSASADVHLDGARGVVVGAPGRYLSRPGFWHGGAGVAACWFGACATLAAQLPAAMRARGERAGESLRSACGRVDIAMRAASALFREAAIFVDAGPYEKTQEQAQALALRVRLAVEALAEQVLVEVGRALGPAPLCHDLRIARLAADLPVFIRQSHAERDQAALASAALDAMETSWML